MKLFFAVVFSVLLISACASPHRPLFISPKPEASASLNLGTSSFGWQLLDKRPKSSMLTIQTVDKVVALPNKPDWRAQLQSQLAQQFQAAGALLEPAASTQLQFNVLTLLAQAKQHPLDHEVHSEVVIEVAIRSEGGHYRKRFSGQSSYTAPFKVDPASVERELNQLTERVLHDILHDQHWQQYLRRQLQ